MKMLLTQSINKNENVVNSIACKPVLELEDELITFSRSLKKPTQPSVPPGSVNEYQLRLGRQRQVWFVPLADERGVCR